MPIDISMFIHPIETYDILKSLKKNATRIESQIHMGQEKGMIRDPALETAIQDIDSLRDNLQQGTEKFFRFDLYITAYGETEKELSEITKSIESILEAQLVYVKPAVFKSEQGFNSTLPSLMMNWTLGLP